jgi:hypothetical protein
VAKGTARAVFNLTIVNVGCQDEAVVPVGNLIWLAKDRESGDAVVP